MWQKRSFNMNNLPKFFLLFPLEIVCLSALALSSCKTYVDGGTSATTITLASLTANTIGRGDDKVTFTAPSGTAYSTVTVDEGTQFLAPNVCSTATIFGLAGTATCAALGGTCSTPGTSTVISVNELLQSNAYRNVGTTQLTQEQEVTTYAGSGTNPALPINYREVSNIAFDDDGQTGTSATYAPRPGANCGTIGNIAARITNCNTNWNGATSGMGGESVWNLVTRVAPNKEVWQDTRTGLLWSSKVGSAKWCLAAGNMQPGLVLRKYTGTGNGTIDTTGNGGTSAADEVITVSMTGATTFTVSGTSGGARTAGGALGAYSDALSNKSNFTISAGTIPFINGDKFLLESSFVGNDCQSSTVAPVQPGLQPATPVSYCTEVLAPALANDGNPGAWYSTSTYDSSKGNLGANSSPGVKWRLPTIYDYEQANIDGIRLVMPDMGSGGAIRPSPDGSLAGNIEWTSSVVSVLRSQAWIFTSTNGSIGSNVRSTTFLVRCVGR
jgi:hypothetical protein